MAHMVVKGSGMGLTCSGEMSDICFMELVEKPFATDPGVMFDHGVHFYGRFKDDGLIIASGSFVKRLSYINRMQELAKLFVIEIESSDNSQAIMLDLLIRKSPLVRVCAVFRTKFMLRRPASGNRWPTTLATPCMCIPLGPRDKFNDFARGVQMLMLLGLASMPSPRRFVCVAPAIHGWIVQVRASPLPLHLSVCIGNP